MNIDFATEYYRKTQQITERFEETISQNWRDCVSKNFLEFIKSEYFQPLLECAKKLDDINSVEQMIVQYCWLVGEKLFPDDGENNGDSESDENKSNDKVLSRDEKLKVLFKTRDDLEIERLRADIYALWQLQHSGDVSVTESGGFEHKAPEQEKDLVRTRVKND